MQRMSSHYYPTTAILIDDSERFLTSVNFDLDTKLSYITFAEPYQPLQYIRKHSHPNLLVDRCLSENKDSDTYGIRSTEHQIKMDISFLYKEIYNSERFHEPTVVVVDYSMPTMNGAEFCRRLKESPLKKILLTGEADENLAVNLFNAGLIHKFILKDTPNFGEVLNGAIKELQQQYFQDQSEILIKNLLTQTISCLKDPEFIKVFQQICFDQNIAEYYLIQNTGSFLLLKYDGAPLWLVVITDLELKDYLQVAEDNNASKSVLDDLKTGKRIPYFQDMQECLDTSDKAWENRLYPAEKVKGDKIYYYALIEKPYLFTLDKAKVLSYQNYLNDVWPPI